MAGSERVFLQAFLQYRQDGFWGIGRRHQAKPRISFQRRFAQQFVQGGHIGQAWVALAACHTERNHFAGFDVRGHELGGLKQQVYLTTQQVVQRQCAAAVGDMQQMNMVAFFK